jgi:FkbM family methyltransferase
MTMNSEFYQKLLYKIVSSLPNDYQDNYDEPRFGELAKADTLVGKLYDSAFINRRFFNKSNQITLFHSADKFLHDPEFPKFANLYDMLANEESKELLVTLVAYRMLGYKRVKLPHNNPDYWKKYEECEKLVAVGAGASKTIFGHKIDTYDLTPVGYDLRINLGRLGVLIDFMLEQYKYQSKEKVIEVKPGDIVIDGGGFWGDTAMYFASKAGRTGKVYTFEFIPGNIALMKENLAMNPDIANLVELVPHPLWDKSQDFYYLDHGPASMVSMERIGNNDQKVRSKTIDALVEEKQLQKVDFIKMDIEGAEPYALRGAEQTIRKFKPKLAIAIYHSVSDFVNIPAYIHSLGLGYKLYLGHYTMQQEETLIFATTE